MIVLLQGKGIKQKRDNALLMKQKFPNYLFSTLGLANALLDEGKLEEMDNLIEGHRDIASLFGSREVSFFRIAGISYFDGQFFYEKRRTFSCFYVP